MRRIALIIGLLSAVSTLAIANDQDLSVELSPMGEQELNEMRGKNNDTENHLVDVDPVAVSDQEGTSTGNGIEGTINGGENSIASGALVDNRGHVTLIQNTGGQLKLVGNCSMLQ